MRETGIFTKYRRACLLPFVIAGLARAGMAADEIREVSGILFGEKEITIKAKSQGELMILNHLEGERVTEGTVIAVIDDRQEQIEVSQAKLEFESAERDFRNTQTIKKYVSRDEVNQKKNAYLQKKANLELKEYNLSNTRVVSPIDGVIAKKYFDRGETVSPGDKVFEVVQMDSLVIEMNVPTQRVVQLKLGEKLPFRTDLFKERKFEGEVVYISPVIDAASGTLKVRLAVKNPRLQDSGYELRPGIVTTVEFPSKEKPHGNQLERFTKD